ncbi:MAG: GerW family sporulation protein [Acutalibacteraceae bacterium]
MRPEVQTFRQNLSRQKIFRRCAGAGITITPIAFLSICNGDVKLIQVEPFEGSADRIIQMVPDVVDKISETFSRKKRELQKEEKKQQKNLKIKRRRIKYVDSYWLTACI